MNYPNLFKSRYPSLRGSDWIKQVEDEDRKAFAQIGFAASDYGRKGGKKVVQKYGREYMSRIGARGALVTNVKKMIQKGIENESS